MKKNSELTMLRNYKYSIAIAEGLGMRWYIFNIYFRLFFTIIMLLSDIGNLQTSYENSWGISWNMDVYLCFALMFDVILIVGAILTRHWLAYFDKKGVRFYFIFSYLNRVVSYVVSLFLLGFDIDYFAQTLGGWIVLGIMFPFEYIYWKKRIHLFGNSNQLIYVDNNESNSTQIDAPNFNNYTSKACWQSQVDNQNVNNSKIKFCRKCGFKLIDNSKFCSRCGTEIAESMEMK